LKLIAYRSRSRYEIIEDLRGKGFSPHIADRAAAELSERGWLDDDKLARDTVIQCQRANKGWSRIYAELRKRGIERELAEDNLCEYFDTGKENEAARRLLQKNLAACGSPPSESDIERAARRLSSRGFSPSAVANALHEVLHGSVTREEQGFLDTDS
jgi:regulatory protein